MSSSCCLLLFVCCSTSVVTVAVVSVFFTLVAEPGYPHQVLPLRVAPGGVTLHGRRILRSTPAGARHQARQQHTRKSLTTSTGIGAHHNNNIYLVFQVSALCSTSSSSITCPSSPNVYFLHVFPFHCCSVVSVSCTCYLVACLVALRSTLTTTLYHLHTFTLAIGGR